MHGATAHRLALFELASRGTLMPERRNGEGVGDTVRDGGRVAFELIIVIVLPFTVMSLPIVPCHEAQHLVAQRARRRRTGRSSR